ncbi:SMN family protein Smn1 [Cordyceps fumosorosea ARSEF 2679]|uniref:SMN family protein Smn1 n=1 Tax=Cordyceps fumosorosea (strain ARSEF 2679) TaxID=1081104 RepID=A0A162JU89_CORFA|nr:SMN family protein Smn1 [Cordyceps fumosorosea ARSEF 2679]OAA73882.1 SMN family protein Smn1 [Cordyceps fumosorosea ARSEF 2679]
MASHNININDDEMWDDSVLVASWNEALDEYKKYHSIHARGGTIRELKALSSSKKANEDNSAPDSASEVKIEADQELIPDRLQEQKIKDVASEAAGVPPALPPPQAVLGTVRDENLKKLLMSWYYAGYYTGLYEGQQQQAPQQQQHQ